MIFMLECPGCKKPMLVKTGASVIAEIVTTEEKTCINCKEPVQIDIRIKTQLQKAAAAKGQEGK